MWKREKKINKSPFCYFSVRAAKFLIIIFVRSRITYEHPRWKKRTHTRPMAWLCVMNARASNYHIVQWNDAHRISISCNVVSRCRTSEKNTTNITPLGPTKILSRPKEKRDRAVFLRVILKSVSRFSIVFKFNRCAIICMQMKNLD